MADGKVIIDTSLNNKGFIKGINGMTGQVGGLTAAVKKLGMAIGIAFGTKALVDFGKQAVELGSNVAEVQNVVDVAFGDMAYKIEDFAKTSIQNFGMSQLAAKKTASTYMAMARGMGINEQAAADMAISLTGLTGDVASFYNISQELADIKLKSVFTGETETLKDLGVVMTQANLKAYALSHGLSGNIESMSQAQLVALRYNFVLDQLALANGDFARTADSWANQTRILSMQWQEFMSIMGQALIQVLTPVVRVLNSIVSALISMANTLNSVISGLFGGANTQIQQTADNAEAVGGAISGSVDEQNALTDATKETAKAQKKMLAGFDEVNKLSAGDSGSSGGTGTGGGGALALPAQTIAVETTMGEGNAKVLAFFQDLQAAIQPTVDALGRLWEVLKMVGGFAGDALVDFYNTFLVPVGSWVMGEGLPRFIDAMARMYENINWQKINDALHGLWEALAPFAINVGEGLLWFYENVLTPFGTWAANEAVPLAIDALREIIDLARDLTDFISGDKTLGEFIAGLTPAQTALAGIAASMVTISIASSAMSGLSALTACIASIKSLGAVGIIGKLGEVFMLTASGAGTLSEAMNLVFGPGSILAGVAAIVGGAVVALTNFWSMLQNGFSWVQEALMLVGIAITAVGAIVLGAPALVTGVIAGIVAAIATAVVVIKEHWDEIKAAAAACWDGIKGVFSGVAAWVNKNIIAPVTTGFKGFINGLIGMVEGFVNFFIRGVNGIINALNSISVDIPEWVPGIGGNSFGINIPKVPELKLPRLAQGAVIPPNREFMAVLGDQRSGNNIEAPEALIRKIVREEGNNGRLEYLLERLISVVESGKVMKINGHKFAQLVYESYNGEDRRRGVSLTIR